MNKCWLASTSLTTNEQMRDMSGERFIDAVDHHTIPQRFVHLQRNVGATDGAGRQVRVDRIVTALGDPSAGGKELVQKSAR